MGITRRVPPAWVLSIPVAVFGMNAGFIIVTLPQLLAELDVPGGRIATTAAVVTSPGFWVFALTPLLDIHFRRRTYALVFGLLAVGATAFTVLRHTSALEIEVAMTIGSVALSFYSAAAGGWTGALIDGSQSSALGAWNTIFDVCSSGLGILLSGYLMQHFSPAHAALLVLVMFLAPMLSFCFIPAPPVANSASSASFSRFSGEVVSLFQRREVLVALAMFLLPSAAFALTNILGGWGREFHASPGTVSFFGGAGSILAGVIGSFLVPPLARKFSLRPLYLGLGFIGAAFTLGLLLLPRVPGSYGLAFLGENLFQAAAFATGYALVFEVMGKDSPWAATTFGLLTSAMNLPLIYMEVLDGRGFDRHGMTGAFVTDAAISGGTCVLLWIVLFCVMGGRKARPYSTVTLLARLRG